MKKISYLILFTFFLVLMGILFFFNINEETYSFILNGEELNAVSKCGLWNYTNITFIPCLWEGKIQGIFNEYINYSLSPQDNCQTFNSTFIGFNLKNDTKAKEVYDSLLPICENLYRENITIDWLKKNTICQIIKRGECLEWKTKDGLTIKKDG